MESPSRRAVGCGHSRRALSQKRVSHALSVAGHLRTAISDAPLRADFYRGPLAVNELGWVSYQNGAFVLDLAGLGSEPVRRLRMAQAFGAAQMAEITTHYDIGLVMVYESWFSSMPATWRRIAVMHAEK
jgi:hypothetical protein